MHKALGKGLEALIPTKSGLPHDSIQQIEIDKIKVNPLQPRKNFDQAGLSDLAESIKENGIIQPVIVRKKASGFILIAGERRLRAAEIAGFTRIPAVIKQVAEKDALVLALVENLQREDLNPTRKQTK